MNTLGMATSSVHSTHPICSGTTNRGFLSKLHLLSESFSTSLTSTSILSGRVIDKGVIDSTYKLLDKVIHLCQQPRLNLKNSPPYLLETLPDIYEKLRAVVVHCEDDYTLLSNIEHFRILIATFVDKCKQTIQLFSDAKEQIFDSHSQYRCRLIKLSLIFSHLLKDLEALFPNGVYSPTTFRITKSDAAKWWAFNFGTSTIVPWSLFQQVLLATFVIDNENQPAALRNTIDLTCNRYVSIFEFDVFVRLFQPWKNILENWKALVILHPGYMAFMTYDEVKTVLKRFRSHPGPGSYVFRLSCTKLGQWAIGYITEQLKILQTIIQNKSLAQALLDGEREGFYLYPNGHPSQSDILKQLVHNVEQVHLHVSKDQYQLYCNIGSTFELCKICAENNKDIQLEPCGHLLCKHCLLNCQSSGNGQTCPFCRLEIKGVEEVIVKPYQPYSKLHCGNTLPNLGGRSHISTSGHSNWELVSSLPHPLQRTGDNSMKDLIDFSTEHVSKPPPVPPRLFGTPVSSDSGKSSTTVYHSTRLYDKHGALQTNPFLCNSLKPDSASEIGTTPDRIRTPHTTTLKSDSASSVSPDSTTLTLSSTHLLASPEQLPLCACCRQPTSHTVGQPSLSSSVPTNLFHSESTVSSSSPDSQSTLLSATRKPQPSLNYAHLDLSESDEEEGSDKAGDDAQMKLTDRATEMPTVTSVLTRFPCDCDSVVQNVPTRNSLRISAFTSTPTIGENQRQSTAVQCGNVASDSLTSINFSNLEICGPSADQIESNVIRLLSMNNKMEREVAVRLLTITKNDLEMAHEIWMYFMPRPDCCMTSIR